MLQTEVAIVGAGPAGLAAARALSARGIDCTVLDDQPTPGGQILRQPPAEFQVRDWLSERVYRPLHALVAAARGDSGIRFRYRTQVLGISGERGAFRLDLLGPEGCETFNAARVIVATGCYDMPVSFPGAFLPGVMAAGGIQAFVKSQQLVPGSRFVFAGTHPLQLIVAEQVARGGGDVVAVLFHQRLADFLALLRRPVVLARQPANLAYFARVFAKVLAAGIPVRFGQRLLAAEGGEQLETVRVASGGAEQTLAADRLGICYGFLSNNDLLRQAGAACQWSVSRGGWIGEHDEGMQTGVPGLYAAGESTGVGGAPLAQSEGAVAGHAAADDLRGIPANPSGPGLQRRLAAQRAFADLLGEFAFPGEATLKRFMTDDSPVCKCEELSAGVVREALVQHVLVSDLSALKLLTRCGMGHCQGRYCHYNLRLLLAEARGIQPESAGAFRARFPARPVTLGELAGGEGEGET